MLAEAVDNPNLGLAGNLQRVNGTAESFFICHFITHENNFSVEGLI